MKPEQFENLVSKFLTREGSLMSYKAGEYSDGSDRLLNFRQVAAFLNMRPSEVALSYLLKHIQSIGLAVQSKKYAWTWETESGEGLKQRIADARNYLLLLAACLDEETVKAETETKNESD